MISCQFSHARGCCNSCRARNHNGAQRTPYADTELADLSWVQSADTLYLFHPSYAPRKLTRSSDTSWTLTTVSFDDGPLAPINSDNSIRVRVSPVSGSDTYYPGHNFTITANSAIFQSGHVGGLFYMEEIYFDQLNVAPYNRSEERRVGKECRL